LPYRIAHVDYVTDEDHSSEVIVLDWEGILAVRPHSPAEAAGIYHVSWLFVVFFFSDRSRSTFSPAVVGILTVGLRLGLQDCDELEQNLVSPEADRVFRFGVMFIR
jgi:hypothetical protein